MNIGAINKIESVDINQSFSIEQFTKKIKGADTVEFNKQIEFLTEQIINGENKNKFLVINGEAGLGKTLYAEKSLGEVAMQGRKAIFVRKFVDDCISSANRINQQCNDTVAIAIHTENYRELKNELNNYNILIITHQRYFDLCTNKSERKIFTKNAKTLIIDEEIDMLKEETYTVQRIKDFDDLLEKGIVRDLYSDCTKEIEGFLKTNKTKTFFRTNTDVSENLKQLKAIIKNSKLREFANTRCIIFDNNIETAIYYQGEREIKMTKSDFLKEIDTLENFINYICYAENSYLYTYDRRIKFWKLENNIILDASASLNSIYTVGTQFNVKKDKKVVNHDNWTIYIINQNTNKSNKSKTENVYDVINNEIANMVLWRGIDKTLVIGSKEEQKYISTEFVDYNWFGNITGKNDWKDFSRVFIIHNPQYPFHTYVTKYMLYAGEDSLLEENLGIRRDGKVVRFASAKLEKLRQTTIAAEIYQAIKRINRLNEIDAEVMLTNNDIEIINLVISQFVNIVVEEFKFEKEIIYKETKLDKYNQRRKDNSYATTFIELLTNLEKGVYKKSYLRELIGYKNNNTFARDVLNKIEVVEYMYDNNIEIKGQSIIKM